MLLAGCAIYRQMDLETKGNKKTGEAELKYHANTVVEVFQCHHSPTR